MGICFANIPVSVPDTPPVVEPICPPSTTGLIEDCFFEVEGVLFSGHVSGRLTSRGFRADWGGATNLAIDSL